MNHLPIHWFWTTICHIQHGFFEWHGIVFLRLVLIFYATNDIRQLQSVDIFGTLRFNLNGDNWQF